MGNITNSTSTKSALAGKAIKALAAIAFGIGAAIIAKRRHTELTSDEPLRESATHVPEPSQDWQAGENKTTYTQDDITLRAYFISERRRLSGLPADPRQDWLDAERELMADTNQQSA